MSSDVLCEVYHVTCRIAFAGVTPVEWNTLGAMNIPLRRCVKRFFCVVVVTAVQRNTSVEYLRSIYHLFHLEYNGSAIVHSITGHQGLESWPIPSNENKCTGSLKKRNTLHHSSHSSVILYEECGLGLCRTAGLTTQVCHYVRAGRGKAKCVLIADFCWK